MVDPEEATDVDPFAALEARLNEQFDDDEIPSLDYARSDAEAEAEIEATMARLRERAANPPEPDPELEADAGHSRETDGASSEAGQRRQSVPEPSPKPASRARSHGLRILDEDLDLDDDFVLPVPAVAPESNHHDVDQLIDQPKAASAPATVFGDLVDDSPPGPVDDDDESLFAEDHEGMWTDEPVEDQPDLDLDLEFDPVDPTAIAAAPPVAQSGTTARQTAISDALGEVAPSVAQPEQAGPSIPGSSVPSTRLATPEQMAASASLPPVMLEVSDADPNLPGSRPSARRDMATVDPLALDGDLPDTVDIPDRERPPVAVYLFLTVLTLAALGALLWYTNRNADDPVSTVPDVTAVDSQDAETPAEPNTADVSPESSVGVRMDEAIPLISTAVDKCDKNGLLGTIVSSASSRVQLDLRLQFVDAEGGVYYEAARATGAVDPSQAVTFTFLLLGEPVPEAFAGVDPASCRLEVTGVFGA